MTRLMGAVVILAILVGSACSGTGPAANRPALARATQTLRMSGPDELTRLGPTDPNEQVYFTLSLVLPAGNDVNNYLAALYDPQSPEYRHFLNAQAFGARFGLPLAEIDSVVNWLTANQVQTTF